MKHIRPHITAIAFGLLLTLIGHDAVMATDPHSSTDMGHHGMESAPPDTDCGPTTGAPAQPMHVLGFDTLSAAFIVPVDVDATAGFTPCWSVAPDHPPDTRRALLQVYLN